MNRMQIGTPFNPKQLGAIVLARSTGVPSPEIREFIRRNFSVSKEGIILELSRPK